MQKISDYVIENRIVIITQLYNISMVRNGNSEDNQEN